MAQRAQVRRPGKWRQHHRRRLALRDQRLSRPQRGDARPSQCEAQGGRVHRRGEQPAPAGHAGSARPDARAARARSAPGDARGAAIQYQEEHLAGSGRGHAAPPAGRGPRGGDGLRRPARGAAVSRHPGRDAECGGALRWFGNLASVRLSAGAEYDVMYERRKGYINNNGAIGALKRDEDNTVASTDLYTQAEWKFAERWALHGGARASRVAFRSKDYYTVANADDSGSRTYRAVTPVAGLLYRVSETTSVYGNLGRGFETPTFLELAYRTGASGLNFDLNASTSRHAELGVKTIVQRWARVNAALFDVVTSNEIVVDQNAGGRATFKNVGHTDRKGAELGAETLLPGRVQLRAAYTHLDATFREGFNTVIGVFPNNSTVPVAAGTPLPGVARNQLYGELRYRGAPLHASLEALHRSKVPVSDPNTDFAAAFTVWNLAAGLVQERARWRFGEFARVDNLTNRDYVGSVIVNETNFRYFEPAPRRNMSAGIQASLQF
ncbi:MAG: TonB-dependent receptor [Betaproteobacteria bacterium]|nr:MAG: TonB-dependent receptor [Betaproteobacteria bacterium]